MALTHITRWKHECIFFILNAIVRSVINYLMEMDPIIYISYILFIDEKEDRSISRIYIIHNSNIQEKKQIQIYSDKFNY